HAARGLAGEGALVEAADPRRRRLSVASAEDRLGLGEELCAPGGFPVRGAAACLHGEEPRVELGLWGAVPECSAASKGELEGLVGLAEVMGQMAQAGEDVRAELVIPTDLHEVERSAEVLLCASIVADVVRHPTGHLGEGCGGGEDARAVVGVIVAEQPGCYLGVQIVDHCGVEVSATDLAVRVAEGLHG
ncbi:MAG: hypothetical protein M3R63_09315, partial [Actinomycetota bacterium]|nr:hypothetical protein [Actinomycetota bacterium]